MSKGMDEDPRELRLPLWVRNKLASLRYEIRGLRKAVENISLEDSDTTVDSDPGSHDEIGLGKGARINFYPGEGRRTMDRIQVYLDQNGDLQIQVDGAMVVRPKASNSCVIRVESRF